MWWNLSSVTFQMQVVHMDKSGLHHACFPKNFRAAVFRNISEQLFQLFSQTNFRMLLQVTKPFLQYFLCTSAKVFNFPYTLCKGALTINLNLTFDIPEAYAKSNQRSKMELFAKLMAFCRWLHSQKVPP